MRIGYVAQTIAVALLCCLLLAMAPLGATQPTPPIVSVGGLVTYENATVVPDGWTVSMENLDEVWIGEPWTTTTDYATLGFTGRNYYYGAATANSGSRIRVSAHSPDMSYAGTATETYMGTTPLDINVTMSETSALYLDTGAPANPYPSISGTLSGTITPSHTITVSSLYTYPSPGTGGHAEYVRIWGNGIDVTATWNGYQGDWHNLTFDEPFVIEAGETYNYTIRTGSYPQILHTENHITLDGSLITSTSFVDVNGYVYFAWIPAISMDSQTATTALGSDTNPPVVTMPSANPSVIPNDGTTTSFLSVYVTDDTAIDVVTIDLSPIGGPATYVLACYGDFLFGCNISATCALGIYYLPVTATDIFGNFNNTVSIMLEVIEHDTTPPTAAFTYSPLNPVIHELITFNAFNSTDPDGSITNYEWDFGDGNVTNTTEPTINHSYTSPGVYTVNLTVTNNDGLTNTSARNLTISTDLRYTTESRMFFPFILFWSGAEYPMSADSVNIDLVANLQTWYEAEHQYTKGLSPAMELEYRYAMLDRCCSLPIGGSAYTTFFAFPIVEKSGQKGLGAFENEQGEANRPNVTTLTLVKNNSAINAYDKTLNGTIRLQKTYILETNETVQFLDHKLKFVGTDVLGSIAVIDIVYAGNADDDTKKRTTVNEGQFYYFDRQNVKSTALSHPDGTWYTIFETKLPNHSAVIGVGKEISANETFYVNGVRYDVPEIWVNDTDGDAQADKFESITIRTPLPQGNGTLPDDGFVSSQWIEEFELNEIVPVLPPYRYTLGEDSEPPVVTNPTANPYIIPEDTDNVPLWGEVSNLSVTVTDESTVTIVTIDLSPLGGSATQPMTHVGGDVWAFSTTATIGTAGWTGTAYEPYQLQVTATDEYGNTNMSQSIALTVMKNGDVNEDGTVSFGDVTYLANHVVGTPGFEHMELSIAEVNGDGVVNFADVTYLANHVVGTPGYEVLK